MIVISDTSPICYLVLIGEVDLLPQLYGKVLIPQAVFDELGAKGSPPILREWIEPFPFHNLACKLASRIQPYEDDLIKLVQPHRLSFQALPG